MKRLVSSVVAVAAVLGAVSAPARLAPSISAIAAENARLGTPGWRLAAAPTGGLEAYASEISVTAGDVLHLHVRASSPTKYRVVVFRLGWYAGIGARRIECLPSCMTVRVAERQPTPAPDATTGAIVAQWPITDAVAIPKAWVTGYYVADVVATDGPYRNRGDTVPFILRRAPSAAPTRIAVVAAPTTWEVYNSWGGKSGYGFNSTNGIAATRVSFDRPFGGDQNMFDWEYNFVRFVEREGLDVSYMADVDVDRDPGALLRHTLVVMNGHGEYWTAQVRNALERARDGGTNLVFLGANTGYVQVRYEDNSRTIDVYRQASADPDPAPAEKTIRFRDLTPPRPECTLLGIAYQGGGVMNGDAPRDYTVTASAAGDPWFRETGLTPGATVSGVVGYEWDAIVPACPVPGPLTTFFHYDARPGDPIHARGSGGADAVRYTAPSGAQVFSTGTLSFVWALDDWGHPGHANDRVQRFMRNVLTDLSASDARHH